MRRRETHRNPQSTFRNTLSRAIGMGSEEQRRAETEGMLLRLLFKYEDKAKSRRQNRGRATCGYYKYRCNVCILLCKSKNLKQILPQWQTLPLESTNRRNAATSAMLQQARCLHKNDTAARMRSRNEVRIVQRATHKTLETYAWVQQHRIGKWKSLMGAGQSDAAAKTFYHKAEALSEVQSCTAQYKNPRRGTTTSAAASENERWLQVSSIPSQGRCCPKGDKSLRSKAAKATIRTVTWMMHPQGRKFSVRFCAVHNKRRTSEV